MPHMLLYKHTGTRLLLSFTVTTVNCILLHTPACLQPYACRFVFTLLSPLIHRDNSPISITCLPLHNPTHAPVPPCVRVYVYPTHTQC